MLLPNLKNKPRLGICLALALLAAIGWAVFDRYKETETPRRPAVEAGSPIVAAQVVGGGNGDTVADGGVAEPVTKPPLPTEVSRSLSERFLPPAEGVVSSPFGRRWGRMHEGVDIANDYDTPVRAALSGEVVHSGWLDGYGYTVILEHKNGYTTLYAHMRKDRIVDGGQSVRQGDVIGLMGSSGNSTGPHLHFEVRRNGRLLNPIYIVR